MRERICLVWVHGPWVQLAGSPGINWPLVSYTGRPLPFWLRQPLWYQQGWVARPDQVWPPCPAKHGAKPFSHLYQLNKPNRLVQYLCMVNMQSTESFLLVQDNVLASDNLHWLGAEVCVVFLVRSLQQLANWVGLDLVSHVIRHEVRKLIQTPANQEGRTLILMSSIVEYNYMPFLLLALWHLKGFEYIHVWEMNAMILPKEFGSQW